MTSNTVSFLRDGATAAFDNTLLELRLVNCSLASWQTELGKLSALTLLDLSHNAIQHIPAGALRGVASTLKAFTLVRGKLTYLPEALADLTALQDLDLRENAMMSTHDDVLGIGSSNLLSGSANSLRFLKLASCGLVAVPRAVQGLTAIQVLDLSDNRIVTLNNYQFSSMSGLEELYLTGNPLSVVPYKTFAGLMSLTTLDMSNCRLTYIPSSALGEMPALSQLDLSKNRITVLLDNSFPTSPSLTTVDLSDNTITNFTDMAFNGAIGINTLKMNGCSLTFIPRSLRLAYALRSVHLENNQIQCSCQTLGWIKTWKKASGLIPHMFGTCANNAGLSIDTYVSSLVGACEDIVGR
ncbi:leucine-rich repeat-containing G-protein coupled receptor 5 [Plakobranchus ocellatus]|uniref:Leucine-rich repeat-containing G-protein coupled receptor 5 n=1 Tax=Plakobranchus ocellatus TaxID=259542 RepID=A0AAV4CYU2_9GAST|nr:leucine-rich repeat-containing G-protein coupled receptor 5 [Plakobranchus ocellatus]